jgi:hypothetical protein
MQACSNLFRSRMQLRNFIRRHKWRLRPVKRAVLPLRNLKRAGVALLRKPPFARSTVEYAGPSLGGARQIYPGERVQSWPHRLPDSTPDTTLSEPAWIFELNNIDFWERYGGSVVTSDNVLLADLSPEVWGVENHPIFSQFRLPKPRMLGGRTAIAVTPEAPGNYYHWLIDLLPRLCLIRSFDDFESFSHLLVNGSRALYEESSLRALGAPLEKISYVDNSDRFQIAKATIPSMDHHSKVIAPWKIQTLRAVRDSLPRPAGARARRLYISRKKAAVRRVINETELAKILCEAGFTIVELELLSWPEQIALFSDAEVVVAPHGAALANIVFCQPSALLAEISTRTGYRDYYLRLAASSGVRYCFLEAQPRVTATSSLRATENEDMIVEVKSVQDLLRSL